MTGTQERPGFTVDFVGGEAEFTSASTEAWDNYLDKVRDGEKEAGAKELVFSCCVSHTSDEKTGEHGLVPLLNEQPAALADISFEIEDMSAGEAEAEIDGRSVKLLNMVFRCPDGREWSTYQANLSEDNMRGGVASRMLLETICDKPDVCAAYLRAYPAALGVIMVPVGKVAGRGIRIKRKKA